MKKWVLRVLNVLSAVIIALSLLILLRAVFATNGEVPMVGGYGFLRVLSGSMEPTIPTNSLIVIHDEDTGALVEGDIITFYSPDPDLDGSLNTHRIVGVEQDSASGETFFTTKGDANTLEDEQKVAASDVVGRVVMISGILGFIVSLFSNPLVFVPCVLIPIAILLIYELVSAIRAAKEIARAEDERALRDTVQALRMKKEAEAAKAAAAAEAAAADGAELDGAASESAESDTAEPDADEAGESDSK